MSPVSLATGQDQMQPVSQGYKERSASMPQYKFGCRKKQPQTTLSYHKYQETSARLQSHLQTAAPPVQGQLAKLVWLLIINNTVYLS